MLIKLVVCHNILFIGYWAWQVHYNRICLFRVTWPIRDQITIGTVLPQQPFGGVYGKLMLHYSLVPLKCQYENDHF